MNRNYKFPKFLPPILPFDAKSHYPLPNSVVNDKIEDTRGDSYFHFFSARSAGRTEEEKKKMVYPNLGSQRPINAPREKLSTRIMQIILETPEGSRTSHFVSPSAPSLSSSWFQPCNRQSLSRNTSFFFAPFTFSLACTRPSPHFLLPSCEILIVRTKVRPRDRNELIRLR